MGRVSNVMYTRWSNRPPVARAADHLAWTARAVWAHARWPAVTLIALQLLLALAPAASLRVTQHVINAGLAAAGRGPSALSSLLPWLGALAATMILSGGVAFHLEEPLSTRLGQQLHGALGRLRLEKAARLPLLAFERSELYDQLTRAGDGAAANRLFFGARHALAYGIQTLTLAALFWPVAHWLPFALVLSLAVRSALRAESKRRDVSFIHDQTENQRRVAYVGSLLTGGSEQKELRVFNLQEHLASRWRGLRRTVRGALLGQKRRNALFALPGDAVSLAVTGGTAVVLVVALAHHAISIGAFVALFRGVGMVEGAAGLFASQFALGNASVMEVGYFRDFLALPEESAPPGAAPFPTPLRDGMRCEGLTFAYPGRTEPVLRGLDLHLRPGERVALVGENGSGKSTLAKCLLGLYRPDAGRITADGLDYGGIAPDSLRAAVTAAYQDYVNFQLTLRECIGLGDVTAIDDDERIHSAARRGGADEVADSLAQGYDTPVGGVLEGASGLSGGQWQRIATSRAFMRDAQLLILDEPAAALDPQAEAALYGRLADMLAGRTALLISHRLGSARLADRILVLRGGRIAEDGTHAELLAAGGEYARMWEAQAQWYR